MAFSLQSVHVYQRVKTPLNPIGNHHFPMVFPWFSHGFPRVFLWCFQWFCPGYPYSPPPLTPPWIPGALDEVAGEEETNKPWM